MYAVIFEVKPIQAGKAEYLKFAANQTPAVEARIMWRAASIKRLSASFTNDFQRTCSNRLLWISEADRYQNHMVMLVPLKINMVV